MQSQMSGFGQDNGENQKFKMMGDFNDQSNVQNQQTGLFGSGMGQMNSQMLSQNPFDSQPNGLEDNMQMGFSGFGMMNDMSQPPPMIKPSGANKKKAGADNKKKAKCRI